MTKLNFNYSELSNKIKPSIVGCVNNLNSAHQISSSLSIPYGYEFNSDLTELSSFISNVKNELNYINSWIDQSNTRISNSLDIVNDSLYQIDNVLIQDRARIVN